MLNRDLEEDVRSPDPYMLHASFYECFGQVQPLQSLRGPAAPLELELQHGAAQSLRQRLLRWGQEAKAEAVSDTLCGDLCGFC